MADRFDEVIAELRSDRQEMRREFAAWSAHIDRLQEQTDENIRFLRELDRRGEIALQELVRSQTAMREEIRVNIVTTRRLSGTVSGLSGTVSGLTETVSGLTETVSGLTETVSGLARTVFALVDRLEGGSGGLAPAT